MAEQLKNKIELKYEQIDSPPSYLDECYCLEEIINLCSSKYLSKYFTKKPYIDSLILDLKSKNIPLDLLEILKEQIKDSCKFGLELGSNDNDIELLLRSDLQNYINSPNMNEIIKSLVKLLRQKEQLSRKAEKREKVIKKELKSKFIKILRKNSVDVNESIDKNIETLIEKIIYKFGKVNFNSQEFDELWQLEIRKYINTQEIKVISSKTPVDYKQQLIAKIVDQITYQKASNSLHITISKSGNSFYTNGIILPITFLNKVLSILEDETIPKAFENINIYIASENITFSDYFYRKYKLHLDDTHILGIENTPKFIKYLQEHQDRIKEIINEININKPSEIAQLGGIKNFQLGERLKSNNLLLSLTNLGLSDPSNKFELKKQIVLINSIQNKISKIMTDQTEENIIERLLYKITQTYGQRAHNNITIEEVQNIIEDNIYLFGNEFHKIFKDNPVRIMDLIHSKSEEEINKINEKYTEIMKTQEFLNYKYKTISKTIINIVDPKEWGEYFSSKHSNRWGTLNPFKLGPFGIAQLLIDYEIKVHQDAIKNGTEINDCIFNLFKVFDKTLYLTNFNYVTDIHKIYITDTKGSNNNEHHIICEMKALDEVLMAYFDEIDKNRVARFYSVQNRKDVPIYTSTNSEFENIISFENHEYSSMIVFDKPGNNQLITQYYSSAKKEITSFENFLEDLQKGNIRLRIATSLDVVGDYPNEETQNAKWWQLFSNPRLSKEESMKLTLIGCSNASALIRELTPEMLEQFIGVDNLTQEQLTKAKLVLTTKNLETLLKILKEINNESKSFTELEEIIKHIQKDILYNIEIINMKYLDSKNVEISLDSTEKIEKYFEKRKKDFTTNHICSLEVLAEKALKLGSQKLHSKIKIHCFKLEMQRLTSKFAKDLPKIAEEYKKVTGYYLSKDELPIPVRFSSNRSKEYKEEIFNSIQEIMIQALILVNNKYTQDIDTKKKYKELAEQHIASIVNSTGIFTYKTTYEKESEEMLAKTQYKKIILDNTFELHTEIKKILHHTTGGSLVKGAAIILLINDNNLLKNQKEGRSPNEVKESLADKLAPVKAQYEELYTQYHFDTEPRLEKTEIQKFLYQHQSIEALIDFILNEYREKILSLDNNFLNPDGVVQNADGTETKNHSNIVQRRIQYTTRVQELTYMYIEIVRKLHRVYVMTNASVHTLQKENLNEIIKEKFQAVIKQTQHQSNPFLYSITAAQIQHMADSINPQSGLKM